MKLELKTNTKISYISAYIKEKYPMYHRCMSEIEFGKLINQIQLDSFVKGTSFELVKNGELDSVIDNYVNMYAKNNLRYIWENFDKLRMYVVKVVSENSKFSDSKEFIYELSMKMALNISDQIGFHTIFANNYDNEIFMQYLNLRNSYKVKLVNYIRKVFYDRNEKIRFDKNTINAIFNMISDKLIENYNEENVYNFEYIKKLFVEVSNKINHNIFNRVRYVINNSDILLGISEREVISQIIKMANAGEISAIKIINGEMDDFIKEVIKNKQKKMVNYDDQMVFQYVYDVLLNDGDEEIIHSSLYEFTRQVIDRLKFSEYGFNNADIIEHRCDNLIRNMYIERYCPTQDIIREKMERQSVKKTNGKTKKTVDLLRRGMLKKRIQRDLSCLLIVATLGSVTGVGLNNIINNRNEKDALFLAKSLDTTSYSISHTGDILEIISYDKAVLGVTNYYNELKQYGNEYVNLCFYNAFSDGLSMNEMDSLMFRVRTMISSDASYLELSNILNSEDCFLDFVYDSLVMMGCNEIKDDKYMKSLISYKQSFYGNLYGIASDYHMYANDKNNIDKMIKLYDKYCKKNLVKLGNELQNNSILTEDGCGRSI